ncbi:MAG: hypothetical protein GWN71_41150 [Gammaproteobacteria bacterium]|nr:hypothetical protein [Gemmatimonadota bacterium]NIU79724.1 hypothetical protein [Gammaproteobacteria bacterium]
MRLLCEAVRRSFDQERIAAALREAYALNGPSGCPESGDPASCIANARLPADPAWRPPFEAGRCSLWREAFPR